MFNLCTPAIIYAIFSIVQILFDTFKGLYNTALIKFFFMIIVTFLLNILCINGLGFISWIIVFIPFLFMTLFVAIILYIFGLKKTSGLVDKNNKNNKNITNTNKNIQVDDFGNIIIHFPNYDETNDPIIYDDPYLIILNSNDVSNSQLDNYTKNNLYSNNKLKKNIYKNKYTYFPKYTSDPSYQS